MSEAETFERVLAALHEAALDPARWPGASGLIDEAIGTYGSTLTLGDGDTEAGYRIYSLQTRFRGERRPDLERLYCSTYYPVDERVPRLRRAPLGRLLHLPDLYTEAELKSSAAYNALRTHGRSGNGIDVRLAGPGGSRVLWEITDPVGGDGWSSAQLETIRRLLPHVRHFLGVQRTLAGAGALGATLAELLDATGAGIVQLDARGQIVAANDRALSLLRAGDRLRDKSGVLVARAPRDNAELQGLLARALPLLGVQRAGGAMLVGRSGAVPPLVLHVHPVGRQEADVGGWPVAALVLVVNPVGGAGVDPDVVAAALGLTGMESRVSVLLEQGLSVRAIAAATGRRESTIRSHLKRIFARHGLSRQAELVRLVRSLAGAPGDGR